MILEKITIEFSSPPPSCKELLAPQNAKELESRNRNGPNITLLLYRHRATDGEFALLCLDLGISKNLPGPSFSVLETSSPAHPTRATRTPDTYFYFLAEGSIGAILQLALVVNVIDHSRGNDLGLQAFLLGLIIKTEPPASAEKKLMGMRRDTYDSLYL